METFWVFGYDFLNAQFKSYYVVWKPQANKSFAKHSPEFKSYYVVWKRTQSKKSKQANTV